MNIDFERIYRLSMVVSEVRSHHLSDISAISRRRGSANSEFNEIAELIGSACDELDVAISQGNYDQVDLCLTMIRGHLMEITNIVDFAIDAVEEVLVST